MNRHLMVVYTVFIVGAVQKFKIVVAT